MDRSRRRRGLRVPVRTVVLMILSTTVVILGTAARADQATPTTKPQSGPTTTQAGPTTTQAGPSTTMAGPTTTGKLTATTGATGSSVPGSVPVSVTPGAGGPGTVVRLVADIRGCDLVHTYFYDRRSRGSGVGGGERPLSGLRVSGNRISASYTVTGRDAVGPGRFGVLCNLNHEGFRAGYASFQVRSGVGGSGSGGGSPGGTNAPTDASAQVPDQTDSGVAGTTAAIGDGGFNLAWLLLPAGLLLIGVAVWLGRRWRSVR